MIAISNAAIKPKIFPSIFFPRRYARITLAAPINTEEILMVNSVIGIPRAVVKALLIVLQISVPQPHEKLKKRKSCVANVKILLLSAPYTGFKEVSNAKISSLLIMTSPCLKL